MQTVAETKSFLADAKASGLSEDEAAAVVDMLASNPECGALMPRCGGARKVRVAKQGKGKSGGFRVVYYYGGEDMPIFILAIFGKNEKANLSDKEKNDVAALIKRLRDSY